MASMKLAQLIDPVDPINVPKTNGTVDVTSEHSMSGPQNGSATLPFRGGNRTNSLNRRGKVRFFVLDTSEMTSQLVEVQQQKAHNFYHTNALNEEKIEVWLHRAYLYMSEDEGRTTDPNDADVFMIPYYGHLRAETKPLPNTTRFAEELVNRLYDVSKPHLLLCPSNNPKRSRTAGIGELVGTLRNAGVNLWSVGLERNPSWQSLPPERIVPVPYLVKPSLPKEARINSTRIAKIEDSVFYVGDQRPNAVRWGGCNRSMVKPLEDSPNMFVRITHSKHQRIDQEEYNRRMQSSDFCLVLCGDTPTSRSLASSVVNGCIPIRVGSRLRGLCRKPCRRGFGWRVTGPDNPHLPYTDVIPWQEFPEVNEAKFARNPQVVLNETISKFDAESKATLREMLYTHGEGWIYGFGNPIKSEDFGEAAHYILNSFVSTLKLRQHLSITNPR